MKPRHLVVIGFVGAILLGAFLLMLPELLAVSQQFPDFAALTALNGGGQDASLLVQHMPLTYSALILAASMLS